MDLLGGNEQVKVLVSGAQGMLGREVMEPLAERHRILGVDLDVMDITDPAAVNRVVHKFKPEVIVNVAAYTQVDRCETEESLAFRVNAEGPGHLAEAAAAVNGKLVHVSTDYVFDGTRALPEPYVESDRPNPQSAYGRTKLEGERRVAAISDGHAIVRTAWLYGWHGKNFLKTMLRLALHHPNRPITVVNDQFGCPTWAFTLAQQLAVIAESPDTSGIYHAVGCGFCSWYTLAKHFLETIDVPHRIEPCLSIDYPTPAARPKNAILDNRRLKDAGILQMRDWRRDVEAFVDRHRHELLDEVTSESS